MDKRDVVHTYNGLLVIKKDETLPFVATWIHLEIIVLSKSNKDKYHLYVESKRIKQMNLFTETKLMVMRGEGREG